MMRVGFSKDIHRLVEGRKLLLAGVHISYSKGEMAHSDGDVVLHAVGESILGALALGDLGKFFPDTSDETLNMDSGLIVKKIVIMMKEMKYSVNNIDVSICLEKPKLKEYIPQMRENLALLLETAIDNVSIKAGTEEGMGSVGEGNAVVAYSIVSLIRN